jgi:hypothetical protein
MTAQMAQAPHKKRLKCIAVVFFQEVKIQHLIYTRTPQGCWINGVILCERRRKTCAAQLSG